MMLIIGQTYANNEHRYTRGNTFPHNWIGDTYVYWKIPQPMMFPPHPRWCFPPMALAISCNQASLSSKAPVAVGVVAD